MRINNIWDIESVGIKLIFMDKSPIEKKSYLELGNININIPLHLWVRKSSLTVFS